LDCPTCGLANPPYALQCDCGYDFDAGQLSDTPGWDIQLAWRQKVAAYWSISWLALIASFFVVVYLTDRYSVAELMDHRGMISLEANFIFFVIQLLLARRLVRKNYRSFRVYVVRADGERSRDVSFQETLRLWCRILLVQVVFYLSLSAIAYLPGLPDDAIGSLSGLGEWIRFLVVGPFAVGFALRAKYPAFRFQACGFRYI
jgi:hypothetical protein